MSSRTPSTRGTALKGNSLVTSKCLKISINDDVVRDQCMDVVSNSPITTEEFIVWKEGRRRVKAPIISMSQCTERRARMLKIAQNHKVITSGKIRRLCDAIGGSVNVVRP